MTSIPAGLTANASRITREASCSREGGRSVERAGEFVEQDEDHED